MQTKIEIILKTIAKLKDPNVYYNWSGCHTCNCGILAQVALDTDALGVLNALDGLQIWSKMAKRAYECQITGIPMDKVFSALHKSGFTEQEISELEKLSNIKYFQQTEWRGYAVRENVITYLENWSDDLMKQEAQIQPYEPTKIVRRIEYVKVPESMKGLELLLN